MQKRIKRILQIIIARRALQPFFEFLFWLALKGMNYGAANSPKYSGEERILNILKKSFANKKICVIDVGANYGQYAKLVKKIFRNNVIYYGFEPSKFTFEILEKQKSFPENFHFINAGLSDKTEKRLLFFASKGSVQASFYQETNHNQKLHEEEVILLTLDEYCKEQSISVVDLLKIDVEGHELQVLKGAREKIQEGKIPLIQFEFGNQHILSRTFFRDFFNLLPDYSIYRILQDGLRKMEAVPTSEIFYTANFLAVHNSLDFKI